MICKKYVFTPNSIIYNTKAVVRFLQENVKEMLVTYQWMMLKGLYASKVAPHVVVSKAVAIVVEEA